MLVKNTKRKFEQCEILPKHNIPNDNYTQEENEEKFLLETYCCYSINKNEPTNSFPKKWFINIYSSGNIYINFKHEPELSNKKLITEKDKTIELPQFNTILYVKFIDWIKLNPFYYKIISEKLNSISLNTTNSFREEGEFIVNVIKFIDDIKKANAIEFNKLFNPFNIIHELEKSNKKLMELNTKLNYLLMDKDLEIIFLRKQNKKINNLLQEKNKLIDVLENKIIDTEIENYNKKLVIED